MKRTKETHEAKLRNQMSPMYGLYEMVLFFAEDKDQKKKEAIMKIMISSAKQAKKCAPKVKELLLTIENNNEKNVIKGQIEILQEHIEHPTKPGYRRHDILNKIKELKSKLK